MEIPDSRPGIFIAVVCVAILTASGCSNGGTPNATLGLPVQSAGSHSLGRPSHGNITEYAIPRLKKKLPKTFPIGISLGPDGAMWFAERGLGRLGSITTDGQFTRSCRVTGQARFPQNVTTGPDGNLWAVTGSTRTYRQESNRVPDLYGAVVMMTPSCVQTATSLPMYSDPRSITPGPDGNLWFTEASGYVGIVTTAGQLTECKIPHRHPAYGLALGPDGNLWFAETFNDAIGRITPSPTSTPGCAFTIFPFPKKGGPATIVAGPDGNLWATEFRTARVAKVSPSSGKILKEVQLPAGSSPKGIAVGGDGKLYVAEFSTGKIAVVTMAGVLLTEIDPPTPKSGPWIVAPDSDGNIWFTESLVGKIGKLTLLAK